MLLQLKPLVICIFLAIFSFTANSAVTVSISKKLHWNDEESGYNSTTTPPDFTDSQRDSEYGGLPLFVHRVALKDYSKVVSIVWQQEMSASANLSLYMDGEKERLGNDWSVDARVTMGMDKPYLVLVLVPFRKNGGSFEKLTELSIDVHLEEISQPNLRSLNFAEHSQLSEGTWYKIATSKDGVYKIDKNLLSQLGIDISSLNPQNINIYGNGGEMLPESNSTDRPDDLQKCSIMISGEADGQFNDVDYILFYAKGPDTWKSGFDNAELRSRWIHDKHFYSDSAYYFIRIDDSAPLRVQNAPLTDVPSNYTSTSFQDYMFIENDIYNLAKSGREFFGDEFYLNTTGNYALSMPNMVAEKQAMFETRVAVRSLGGPSNFTISAGGNTINTANVTSSDDALANVASTSTIKFSFMPSGSTVNANYQFNKFSNTAEVRGYIDYIRLNATRSLLMSGSQMRFRDTLSFGANVITAFQLSGASSSQTIWDITDFLHPQIVPYTINGTTAEWKVALNELHEYIAFSISGYPTPTPIGRVANQDLHALSEIDLVIITSPLFKDVANSIAEIHTAEGSQVVVTTLQEVFNEFSCGNPDAIAPRMLMKMLFDRAASDPEKMPKNLLLVGDGDYRRNKGTAAFLGPNVLVFESNESLSPAFTYVSDDYFVLLSDDDDGSSQNLLDAGVGRIPASDIGEAEGYLSKIRAYISENTANDGAASCLTDEAQSPYGPWRNILTFIADDQDGSGLPVERVHLNDADSLSTLMRMHHPEYDIVKIYLDAYKQESTPGGERYPDAEAAIKSRVQNGSLIVTYLGHGGERGWAHERILDLNTINSWTNKYKLPVFLTATCELARYDDPSFNTAGELLVMNQEGGAIAMLTTTRIVFAGSNMQMNLAFFDIALEEENINYLDLGRINMLTKNGVPLSNSSKPNFSLLGDPALKLTYPKHRVVTSAINDIPIEEFSDVLKALQEVEFTGYITDASGVKLTNFNGFVYPTVYDKKTHVYTQNNDYDGEHGVVQEYDVFNKNIFRGKASVINGDFSFKFVVPYDINYTVDFGRVSYYAVAGNVDAHGYSEAFKIGSSLNGAQLNTVGPELELFLNDTTFVNGGMSDSEPIFLALLKDENGINTVGNGIGHDLMAILDNDSQNPIVLNEYYETDLDTYKSGRITYQLPELAEGNHSISLKAWDIHNNSSSGYLEFVVAESGEIALQHVLNYPNPFTTYTEFMFEHNQVCTMLDVRLQVFTVSGKLVKTIEQQVMQEGFRSEPIAWDGTDDYGDRIGRGVYVYKLEVRNESGEKAEQFEKLVILR